MKSFSGKLFLLIIVPIFIWGCIQSKKEVVIEVEPSVFKRISSLEHGYVFFTSSKNPIHKLDDLDPKTVSVWNMGGLEFEIIGSVLELAGAKFNRPYQFGYIGNAYFRVLFTDFNPRLFIAKDISSVEEKEIIESGGVKIKFIEKSR